MKAEPEVRETIGKLTFAGHIRIRERPAANDERIRMNLERTDEQRNIFRVMLTVGIDSKGVVKTQLQRLAKTANQRSPFAAVARMRDDGERKIKPGQQIQGVVRTSVVHHDDIAYMLMHTTNNVHNGACVIERRNQRTYM